MNEFIHLRKRARDKRDKAILQARAEYAETLAKIAGLEQDLLGAKPAKHKTIAACIESVIPSDRPFSTVDILAGLEALDGGRVWRRRSVDNHISRLRDRGLVRRLRKSRGTEPALYVREGVSVPPLPFEDMTLLQAITEVLGRAPMRQTELAVALLEAGYETTMSPEPLRTAIGVQLRKGPFQKGADGRWIADG